MQCRYVFILFLCFAHPFFPLKNNLSLINPKSENSFSLSSLYFHFNRTWSFLKPKNYILDPKAQNNGQYGVVTIIDHTGVVNTLLPPTK